MMVEDCAGLVSADRLRYKSFLAIRRTGAFQREICMDDRTTEVVLADLGSDHATHRTVAPSLIRIPQVPWIVYGILLFVIGVGVYLFGVLLGIPRYAFGLDALRPVQQWCVWYSGIPIILGIACALTDLLLLRGRHLIPRQVRVGPPCDGAVTVALTAYNDEESIADAVRDFLAHPRVARVIVVSNNSADATFDLAAAAGAIAVNELQPGYGRCVLRCLSEAARYEDTPFVVLCEGDRTFRAYDVDKLLAYAPHADIVNGTRTSDPLRQQDTQLTTFMYYGNVFVGKLLESKHLGRGTLSDVGTTYKLCSRDVLPKLLALVNPAINLEFNAHFLDIALGHGVTVVECPITFHRRVGLSKGGNTDNWRGLMVSLRMIRGIAFGWSTGS
jgi:hypothetical protein